jgi:hypothetical protein
MILDKIGSKGLDKNNKFPPSLNHRTTFCLYYNYEKYENTLVFAISIQLKTIVKVLILTFRIKMCIFSQKGKNKTEK